MKIYVGNLSHEVNEDELSTLFSEHGSVSNVTIVRDSSNQISRGFGFVEMVRKVEAKKALKNLNKFDFKGKKLAVNEAKPGRDKKSAGGGKRFGKRR